MRYTALIESSAGVFGAIFPDLPGCTAMAASVEAVLVDASEALRDWVHGVEAQGGRVPPPRTVDALLADPEVKRDLAEGSILASVVLVREAGKPVRANLSLDAGVLAAIDATADRLGVTRSATVELLASRGLSELV